MNIDDPDLKKHVERAAALIGGCPDHLRPIFGLFDALDAFYLKEGEQSPRVQETIRHLLSPEMRPALRDWYLSSGDNINKWALQWRTKLSIMAGEEFGRIIPG
jgi:hypothetical protein